MSLQPDMLWPTSAGVAPVLPGFAQQQADGVVPESVMQQLTRFGSRLDDLQAEFGGIAQSVGIAPDRPTALTVLHGYLWVFVIAFVVTLVATPIMRRLAIRNGIIDHPKDPRKVHRIPVAYMGGVAVFLGLMAGVFYSYLAVAFPGLLDFHASALRAEGESAEPIPWAITLGMFVIMLVGLLDDVLNISPRVKVAGQLFAAAALAFDNVGVAVAAGIVRPAVQLIFGDASVIPLGVGGMSIPTDQVVYWTGTAIIAVFVIGGCNAANLIDGLDGLLSGVTAIAVIGLLVVSTMLALRDDGVRDAQRVILCLAVLGGCLGFLPHNFNPATIFLGDAGSMLLGYCAVVIILTLGDAGSLSLDFGRTHLVFAGLLIWGIPILDTVLAIIRRKMAGRPMSAADDQHLHHMLKRSLGVKGAVLALYGLGVVFAALGVLISMSNAKIVYAFGLVFASFVVVTAIKIARRKQIEQQVLASMGHGLAESVASSAGTSASSEAGARAPEPAGAGGVAGTIGAPLGDRRVSSPTGGPV